MTHAPATPHTLTPSAQATRRLIGDLKESLKADALRIRAAKTATRALQRANDPGAPAAQSELAQTRRQVRVAHLLYGLLRGQSWEQMERGRPEGDPQIRALVIGAYRARRTQTGGVEPELGPALAALLEVRA